MKKLYYSIVIASLAISIAITPAFAAALTQSQIDAIVALLTSFGADSTTISNVQTSLTGGTPASTTTTTATYNFTVDLTIGSTGADVVSLQDFLISKGHLTIPSGVSKGYFGSLTQSALAAYQTSAAISPAVGYFGPITRANVNALSAPSTTTTTTTDTTTTTTPVTGQVTVSLASDTPGAGTLVATQANADLAHFTITNGTSSEVKVTAVKLQRIGVSGDTTPSSVYLFEGAKRLTDSASVSSGYINFGDSAGIVTLAAGASTTLKVLADIAVNTSGQTVGVKVDSITTSPSVTVSGAPSGNIHSIATATLATASFTNATLLPTGTPTTDPTNDVRVWEENVVVGTRAVKMNRISLKEVGSINFSDINNFKLYMNSVQVGSAVANLDSAGYVTFDLSSAPKQLETGTYTVKVTADIIGGSSRTYSFSLRNTSDVNFVDTTYGVEMLATVDSATFSAQTTGTTTINSGVVTLTKKTDSPSGTVVKGASDVTLGTWDIKATGEQVKIDTLRATYASSVSTVTKLRNGRLLLNGVQIGSTADLLEDSQSPAYTQYTVNITLTPGVTSKLELKADIFDNDGVDNLASGVTLNPEISTSATNNAQGKVSGTVLTAPASDVVANQLSVGTGTLTLAKYSAYTNQSTVIPKAGYKLGHFVLSGNSAEAVNISAFSVDFTSVTNTSFSSADLTNVYIKYGSNTTTTKSTVVASANSYSISYTMPINGSLDIQVYGDVGSTITSSDSIKSGLAVTATTAQSGTSANIAVLDGQTITAAAGSITSALDTATTAPSKNVAGNTTENVSAFRFTAVNDSFTITELAVKLNAATATAASAVSSVVLKTLSGATLGTASIVFNNSNYHSSLASTYAAVFTGLNISVPANNYTVVPVALQLGTIGVNAAGAGMNVQTDLALFKSNTSQGVSATDTNVRTANAIYVYRSIPTITNVSLPSTSLTTGTLTLAKVQVQNDAQGAIAWKKIIFTVAKTTGSGNTLAITSAGDNTSVYDESNNPVAGTITVTTLAGANTAGSITFVATNEQTVSGTKTYTLKASVAGTLVSGDNINTSIANAITAYAAPVAYSTVAATSASFVWSDQSGASHSESSADWNPDFKVRNLPTDSQTLKL